MSAIYSSFLNNNLKRVKKVAADSASSTTKNKVDKKIVRLVLAILFLVGLIIFQISTTYSIYIKEYFPVYGTHGLGVLFAINAFMVVFLQTPIVNWFQAYNKVLLVGLGAFLMGVGMFVLVFPSFFLFAVISCVIYTVGEMLFFSVAQYICYQYGDDNKKGHSMAIYRMVYASSRVLAPIGGSFIYQELGGKSLWVICGLIGIGCLLACYSFREKS
jgi:MFS family permease